jgi:hypothetical protein
MRFLAGDIGSLVEVERLRDRRTRRQQRRTETGGNE